MKSYLTNLQCGGYIAGVPVTKFNGEWGKIEPLTEDKVEKIESLEWFKTGRIWIKPEEVNEKGEEVKVIKEIVEVPAKTILDKHFSAETLKLIKDNFTEENYSLVVENVEAILKNVHLVEKVIEKDSPDVPTLENADYKLMKAEYEQRFGKKVKVGISKEDLYNELYKPKE